MILIIMLRVSSLLHLKQKFEDLIKLNGPSISKKVFKNIDIFNLSYQQFASISKFRLLQLNTCISLCYPYVVNLNWFFNKEKKRGYYFLVLVVEQRYTVSNKPIQGSRNTVNYELIYWFWWFDTPIVDISITNQKICLCTWLVTLLMWTGKQY